MLTRSMIPFLQKHISGHPTIVSEYMPGGGGIKAANHVFKNVKPDGLTIGRIGGALVANAVLGEKGVLYDLDKLIYLGSPHSTYHWVFLTRRETGVKSVDDLRSASKLRIGAQAVGHSIYFVGRMFAYLVGIKDPSFVVGYSGTELDAALARGEIDARINNADVNIITIEDPVEIQLPGVSQIEVSPKIGLTFAAGLRTVLRQDPDVILVGEIRDLETAEIAIQASLTGHLVFATLHTNDAPSAITRLVDMGVEPYLVASSLVAVLAQRLVRVLCVDCREAYVPTAEEWAEIGVRPRRENVRAYRAKGCPRCNQTGFRGRVGIFELMMVDDDIRTLITQTIDAKTIKHRAMTNGMKTLRGDGARKVLQGVTAVSEVLRATEEEGVVAQV